MVLNACHPLSAQPYLADSVRYFRLEGSLARHLLKAIRKSVQLPVTGSALRRLVTPVIMASADFCRPIPTPLDVGSTLSPEAERQISQGKTRDLHPICPPHLLPHPPGDYRALDLAASLPGCGCLVCGFCPSGRDFAYSFLQIPDHSGHPCCSANGSRHQGP